MGLSSRLSSFDCFCGVLSQIMLQSSILRSELAGGLDSLDSEIRGSLGRKLRTGLCPVIIAGYMETIQSHKIKYLHRERSAS